MNITFDHKNGWMTEHAVTQALGLGNSSYVRKLPIPRTDMRAEGAKRAFYRYRVEDIKKYLEDNTATPETLVNSGS